SKQITIANAMAVKSPEEIAAGRKRLQELYESRGGDFGEAGQEEEARELAEGAIDAQVMESEVAVAALAGETAAADLVERSRHLLDRMHAEDREEAIDLHERIEIAVEARDEAALGEASRALRELLFFMEGRPN